MIKICSLLEVERRNNRIQGKVGLLRDENKKEMGALSTERFNVEGIRP